MVTSYFIVSISVRVNRSISRMFYVNSGSESVDWSQATFTGTYKGRPVVVVYDGGTFLDYTTSSEGSSAYIRVSAKTVPLPAPPAITSHVSPGSCGSAFSHASRIRFTFFLGSREETLRR